MDGNADKPVEYTIVCNAKEDGEEYTTERFVESMLDDGWELYGPPFVMEVDGEPGIHQAMIRRASQSK